MAQGRGPQHEIKPPGNVLDDKGPGNDNGPGPGGPGDTGKAGPKAPSTAMVYHGGPVLVNGVNVYYIWYGNWSGNSATTILPTLASRIGGSPYFNINSTYYNASNVHVQNLVQLQGQTTDNYSQGKTLSDAGVLAVVSKAITSNALPSDTNGVYFVLTSSDVNESSGFCTQYCGWHYNGKVNGVDIKYSFVGNPDRCPSACEAQTKSPNGNAGADGMASIIAHELEESTTDPDVNAWYDRQGAENADKCAWKFGTVYAAPNGSYYNVNFGGTLFLIQQNWVNTTNVCAIKY